MQDRKFDGRTAAVLATTLVGALGCNFVTHAIATPGPENTGTPQSSPLPDATSTPTSIFEASATPVLGQEIWVGQAEVNDYRANQNDYSAFLDYLTEAATRADQLNGLNLVDSADSARTAFVNEIKGPQFDAVADPLQETGNEMTGNEIRDFRANGNVFNFIDGAQIVSTLMKPLTNNPNVLWMGVHGNADDRDAITAVLASALRFQDSEFKGGKVDPNTPLADTIRYGANGTTSEVREFQDQIVKRTLNKELPISDEEKARRTFTSEEDASASINEGLRRTDQIEVCEEVRLESTDGTRDGQPQGLIKVEHVADGANTVEEANVSGETFGFILIFDKTTGKWDVTAVTSRGFSNDPFAGDMSDAVSANELEPCGEGEVPVPTATHRPNQPGPTPTRKPPEVESTVTQAPTQPPQPTRTEGGNGETPVVNTPENTPVPATEQVNPTVPPTDEPVPTPIF